jgi:hypothetical protein
LVDLHFEVLKHPPYSPDLAPSDYYDTSFLTSRNTSREEIGQPTSEKVNKDLFLDKPLHFVQN